jgi:hypothetical protein
MKKKGILFTITTIFLLLAVFLLLSAYLVRNRELHRTAVISSAGSRLSYVYDDAADDIYSDLLSINLESISRDSAVIVIFNHTNLTSAINHAQLMQDYEDFIEGAYSSLNNLNIQLTNFNNSFTLEPYNSTFIIDSSMIYVYTDNHANINSISLQINTSQASNTSQGFPADTGDIKLNVEIMHSNGTFSSSASLDPESANSPFYVNFASGARLEVNFGQYSSRNGVLRINASALTADTNHLEYNYSLLPEKVTIKGGNISITSAVENITKNTEIIIAEE